MKRGLVELGCLCLVLFFFSGTTLGAPSPFASAAEETAGVNERSVTGEWELNGEEWRYKLSGDEYLEKEWVYDSGKWYYMDEDGYMVLGSQKIGGKYYYFQENGEMAIGWAFDEETEKWYFMNNNGTRKTGWYEAGSVWYWFDSSGAMFNGGSRMIDTHKYYFFENGQMASNTYIGTLYYGEDGLRDRRYDMTVQGKRKPTKEEQDAITAAMGKIPGEWMDRCLKAGWEFMYYTDKDYYAAPATEQGIFYVYHKTDKNYKKIKFTKPESIVIAFGEYIASVTGNDKEENIFMVDFQQYLMQTTLIQPLPSYFDDKTSMWFGRLFESYCDPDAFYEIRKLTPDLGIFLDKTIGVNRDGRKPTLEELRDNLYAESGGAIDSMGPSTDKSQEKTPGPAGST